MQFVHSFEIVHRALPIWLFTCLAEACRPVANPSGDCAFDVTNVSSTIVAPEVSQHLITAVCKQGSSPNCASHRYSFSGSHTLRNGRASVVGLNATNLVLNVTVGVFANLPGNYTLQVLGYDQNCRVFEFCWSISAASTSSGLAEYITPSPLISMSYVAAYLAAHEVRFPVASRTVFPYNSAINLSVAMPQRTDNRTLYTAVFSLSPAESSFQLDVISVGFTRSYGYWDSARNISWQLATQHFGFELSAPVRNGSAYSRTLSWQIGWPTHHFFLTVRRRDAVNLYPHDGLGYLALHVEPMSSASGCCPPSPLLSAALSLALTMALLLCCHI